MSLLADGAVRIVPCGNRFVQRAIPVSNPYESGWSCYLLHRLDCYRIE